MAANEQDNNEQDNNEQNEQQNTESSSTESSNTDSHGPESGTAESGTAESGTADSGTAEVDSAESSAESAPVDADSSESSDSPATEANPAAEADSPPEETPAGEDSADTERTVDDPFAIPADPLALIFKAPDLSTVASAPRQRNDDRGGQRGQSARDRDASDAETDDNKRSGDFDGEGDRDAEAGQSSQRSSRRRRRSRGRSGGSAEGNSAENGAETATEDSDHDGRTAHAGDDDDSNNGNGSGGGGGSRRRRKRRRGDADLELEGSTDGDPANTVTRVRAPRQAASTGPDAVTSLKGSTRLEAKRQRRRDSRSGGRQRRHVVTEAEFLARRESVDRKMLVRQRDHRIQIAVLEDGVLAEHFVSNTTQDSLIGNVYVGKVQNVLPSMEAAFVDIGRGRNAVLYAGEVNWDNANLEGKGRKIENALKSGDSVVVQVTKDPVGHKGARLTSQVSLPGRYLVYVPGGSMTGISRKLPDVERSRLKKILKDHLPENAGVIVRTAAEGTSEQELMHDINRLRAQWEGIEEKSKSTKTLAPELLYFEPDLTIKVVRDVFNEDFSSMVVQGEEVWDNIEAYVTYVAPDLLPRLEQWKPQDHDGEDLFASHRIDEQLQKALDRKVFLPSGGSLVIDRTEAMTVVDVNTGKFTGSGGNLEETVTKNNLEAAEEIVRQLRLRDIGGIIVIDFIDMVLESNRDLVLRRLVECLGRDRTKHQVAEVTSLGLVQMTRKRMGTGLVEIFSETCEHCNGRGIIVHDMPVEHRRSHHAQGEPRAHSAGGSGGSAGGGSQGGGDHDGGRKSSRSERRRRSRERQAERDRQDQPDSSAEQNLSPEEEAERQARAEAARAAFANMAAAAANAHEDKGSQDKGGQKNADQENSSPDNGKRDEGSPTLNFGGETVEVPRGRRKSRRASSTPDLAALESALDQRAPRDQGSEQSTSSATPSAQPATSAPAKRTASTSSAKPATTAPASGTARPQRRRRAASSDGTSGDIRTVDLSAASADAGNGRRFSASASVSGPAVTEKAGQQSSADSAAPMMLGVGVRAEDITRSE
ncbi:Rne/Rng family ribonuclease [Citricoccus sp. GCM10030269]|uniref:Rne/Rng family ribonuclease n=1 Tax=Citricoccus sp. GCM10030269 TaxID=3273388 RepID=UPI00360ACC13